MDTWAALLLAVSVAAFALVSRQLQTAGVSSFMVFVALGVAVGPAGVGMLDEGRDLEVARTLFETALMLVLFTEATTIRLRVLHQEDFLPIRLLGIGLPLTMLLGLLLAWLLFPRLGVWELTLMAVILAPTDAALGQAAIEDRRVPGLVRHGLNVESGLNDGMVLPFFTIALAGALAVQPLASSLGPVQVFLRSLVVTPLLAAGFGWFVGRALTTSSRRGWNSDAWAQILVLATAGGAYALATAIEGSGFIAAWVAGLLFGKALRRSGEQAHTVAPPTELAEVLGSLLAVVGMFLFGAFMLGPLLGAITWQAILYSVLSVTVVRMLPVAIALAGTGLARPTIGYLGWFGPRGLASVVLGLIAVEQKPGGFPTMAMVVATTVAVSVYAHGATARWLAGRYGAWFARAAGTGLIEETGRDRATASLSG